MPFRVLLRELRFAEERVLIEQLRLLLGSVIGSTLPVVLLSALMALTLSHSDNHLVLLAWFAIVVAGKLGSWVVARHYLKHGIKPGKARPIAWLMISLYLWSGVSWGVLPWLVLDDATSAEQVITLSLMAGVIGSAMAQTSAVLGVFVVFASAVLGLTALKLLFVGESGYYTLMAVTVLYFFSLLALARTNAIATLDAITLRFENSELLEQLRIESETAEAARLEAEQANAAKSKFLAAASHDLRQPVHAQGLFLSVLAGTRLDEQQRELLDNIRRSSQAASEMLASLLDFSRIEAGVIKPQSQALRLQPLLDKLEREMAPLAEARGLVYRSRETPLAVDSDPALLELVLRNLISNAIRYTESGGLLVGVRRRGDRVRLEVWDTGIGIEAGQQREVFREFHQLGNPEHDSRKGLGLGLAIVDGLAHALDHRLSMRSLPGRGSVFRLSLPRTVEAIFAQETDALLSAQGRLDMRVLIIDDEEGVRSGMLHLLRDWGCDCRVAEGGEDALQIAEQWRPELIISDYRLRERHTGSEAIAALRERLQSPIPALLVTGDTAPERLREARESGIPLMHKPVSPAELFRWLQHLSATYASKAS